MFIDSFCVSHICTQCQRIYLRINTLLTIPLDVSSNRWNSTFESRSRYLTPKIIGWSCNLANGTLIVLEDLPMMPAAVSGLDTHYVCRQDLVPNLGFIWNSKQYKTVISYSIHGDCTCFCLFLLFFILKASKNSRRKKIL